MAQRRRHYRRYRVTDLQGTLKFAHPATVLDLSRSGAALETGLHLLPGRSYPLQIESSDGLTVTTLGRVVWCTLTGTQQAENGESTPIYRAGLEFEKDLSDTATRLFDRLDQEVFAGIDTRLSARYKMSDLASTLLLRDQSTFEVRTLSRGGIGAALEYSPRVGTTLELVLPLDEPVEVWGRVVEVSPSAEDPKRFLVRIEFVGLTSVAQNRVNRYIDRLRGSSSAAEAG